MTVLRSGSANYKVVNPGCGCGFGVANFIEIKNEFTQKLVVLHTLEGSIILFVARLAHTPIVLKE